MKKIFALVLILGFVFVGCAKKDWKKAVAKVGSTTITEKDLRETAESLPPPAQKMFEGEEGMSRLLDEIIKKELLYLDAKKKGLDKDPAYSRKVEDSKKIILISILLEKEIEEKAKMSDKEVRDFYEKNMSNAKGKSMKFEVIKDELARELTNQRRMELFDSYIESLKKTYKIDINSDALAALSKEESLPKEEKEAPKK